MDVAAQKMKVPGPMKLNKASVRHQVHNQWVPNTSSTVNYVTSSAPSSANYTVASTLST